MKQSVLEAVRKVGGQPVEKVVAASQSASSTLRTFDVFDTVITRLVGSPAAAFYFVARMCRERGLWRQTDLQFVVARQDAEARERSHLAGMEVTLDGIYRQLAFAHGLSPALVEAFAEIEIAIERRLIRAVPGAMRTIGACRAAGHSIHFISDMYLPADVIGDWLVQLEVMRRDTDRLWVSSTYGGSKGNGQLFEHVHRAHASMAFDWKHVGDNLHADVEMPRRLGISSEAYLDCHLTRAELALEQHASATGGLSSLLAGASRWLRLSLEEATSSQRLLNEVVADTAGPALYAFVLWVVRTAHARGIRRVWFMARDGQVLIPMARSIAARLGIELDIGYLYGGRQVVKVAALREVDASAIEWMTGGAGFMSVQEVLRRVGLDTAGFEASITESGLPLEGAIGWPKVNALGRFLQRPEVGHRILEVAAERRHDVLDYFRECGIVDGGTTCIVDIGWRGTVVRAVDDLIGRAESSKHLFLYFGLYARPVACEGLSMLGYLFDLDERTGLNFGTGGNIPNVSSTMEIFCQADHGSIMHIRRESKGFTPVCLTEDLSKQSEWNVEFVQRRLCLYAETVPIELCSDPDVDLRTLVEQAIRTTLCSPSLALAKVMGGIPFIDDQAGAVAQPFARAYGLQDLQAAFREGSRPQYGMNWWTEGAWTLTSEGMRRLMRLTMWLGQVRRRHLARASTSAS